MLSLLVCYCLCSDVNYPHNLTEICINPLGGDCHGIYNISISSEFESLCSESTELTLYLINNYDTCAFFNMNRVPKLKKCTIIGLSNYSRITINTASKDSTKIDFKAENVNINIYSEFQSGTTFNSLDFMTTTTVGYISAKYVKSDPISLFSSSNIYSQSYDIDFSHPLPDLHPLVLHLHCVDSVSTELSINILGLEGDYSLVFGLLDSDLTIYYDSTSIKLDIYSEKTNLFINDTSLLNTINISTTGKSERTNDWACGISQLNIFHTGQLIINLLTPNFFFGTLSVNKLNFTSESSCTLKILNFETSNSNNYNEIDIGPNISIELFNDFKSNSNFVGEGEITILSDFTIEHFTQIKAQHLSFGSSYASFKVDVTRDQKEALIFINDDIDYLNDIVIYPVYNKSKFSIPEDVGSLLGKTLLSFCAPNADIDHFVIRAMQSSDENPVPPGFTIDSMSFSLQQNQNRISLVFAKDPTNFTTSACIFTSDPHLCENISDWSINAAKGETPFEKEITSQYIDIKITEDLPSSYSLDFSKLAGKHEIRISSVPLSPDVNQTNNYSISTPYLDKENQYLIKVNIIDSRPDTTETSLTFDGIEAHFDTNTTDYNKIYLTNGATIINDANLSTIQSLEVDFKFSKSYKQLFYGCHNIKMHHVQVDEIKYYPEMYTFSRGSNIITFPNENTYTLLVENISSHYSQITTRIHADDVKPLIIRSNSEVPLYIKFTELTGETPTNLIAVQLQLDSPSPIYLTSPTYNIPVEIISLKDSSTFEKMKRITVNSESSIVDRGFFPNTFTVREDSVSFIAFGSSSKRPIQASFSEIDIYSDAFILSDTVEKGKHNFGNYSYIANDVKVNYGVVSTLIYGEISKSITVYENSVTNLFHVLIRSSNHISITYYITLGQTPPIINLIENQNELVMPSKTPFCIKDDDSSFSPQTINIVHKLPHRSSLFTDFDNDTIEYCILNLRSIDNCNSLLNSITFDPDNLDTSDGYFTFHAKCLPECLGIVREFHKSSIKPNPNKLDMKTIIIIAVLSGVTLILIIVIIVLVVKRKQNPNDYMKSFLMTLPSDM